MSFYLDEISLAYLETLALILLQYIYYSTT